MTHMSGSSLCYHGKLSRDSASKTLLNNGNGVDGCFLIRDCSSAAGDYVLSIWNRNQVMHFQLHCFGDNKFGIQDGPIFHGLDSLVTHYKSDADGLPCRITDVCPGGRMAPLCSLKYGLDTALHKACTDGNINVTRKLLEDNSVRKDINSRNMQGYTPLHLSCARGDDDIVTLLIKAGAHISALDAMGRSPILLVCVAGHASTLRTLILQGHADFHERNPLNGYVPLHEVAVRGFLDCVRVLLSFKASMHPRTFDGDTPKDLALKHGKDQVVDFFDNFPVSAPISSPSQWLHQNLDRNSAVVILEQAGLQPGSFLVRSSIRCHGYFVLSAVSYNSKVFHFQIRSRADRWFFIDDGPLFESLPHLIDHYMQYADGLPITIKKPIPTTRRTVPLPPIPSAPHGSISRSPPKTMTSETTVMGMNGRTEGDFNRISKKTVRPNFVSPIPSLAMQTPDITLQNSCKATGVQSDNIDEPGGIPQTSSVSNPQTSIPRESLELGPEIGVGEFGSVLRGTWNNISGGKICVAMKTLHQDKLQQGEKEFLREARVMSHLHHPCIVRLLGVCLGPPMILVTELVKMGALLDYVIDYQQDIGEDEQKIWAAQIAFGMMYLEQKRFVHRDLATRNILLASKTQCKISDFGLSRAVGTGSNYYQAQQGGRWPVKWYSPESINYGTFSHKSDVWSYGVTLWEMFTFGDLPYGEKTGGEVIAFIEQGERLEKPQGCPNHTYDIMLKCWHIDPVQRPTFDDLHTIFSTDPEYEDARKYTLTLK